MTSSTRTTNSSDHRAFARLGYGATAAVAVAFGLFASLAPLGSATIAVGKVTAESNTKPLQHLEGGIVREILVKDSQSVKAGDILFRLEPTKAQSNSGMVRKQIDVATAAEVRLLAEREGATALDFPSSLISREQAAAAIADQRSQFKERRLSVENQKQILRARIEQANSDRTGYASQEAALKNQITSITAEIDSVTDLYKKGLYTKSRLMALQRQRAALDGDLGSIRGGMTKASEIIAGAKTEIAQVEQAFREKAAAELADVRAQLADLNERLSVADDIMTRVDIRAPQDGIVQGIKVRSAGAIVKPGDTIADLVPTGDKLVISAKISPIDIDSVTREQSAEIRFPGFASRGLPVIMGTVDNIAADSTVDEATRQPYFHASISIDLSTIPAAVQKKLLPGMIADVIIATDDRTIVNYFIGPLTDAMAKSMREP
jgi:HlyD family secretion protein